MIIMVGRTLDLTPCGPAEREEGAKDIGILNGAERAAGRRRRKRRANDSPPDSWKGAEKKDGKRKINMRCRGRRD